MVKSIHVLCVDDDPQLCKLLQRGLGSYGYKITTATDSNVAISLAVRIAADVVILDIDLGSAPDGIELCQRLREWSIVPIIMMSERNEKSAKIAALDAGADDYLVKPFDVEELAARIRAILRRSAFSVTLKPSPDISINGLVINLDKRRVTLHGDEIYLTPREYDMLRILAINAGKVVATRKLLDTQWKRKHSVSIHYVAVYINALRKKLGEYRADAPQFIFTEPGVGYRFVDTETK